MDVRAQVSMVFHMDKCVGCHTCSVACKNFWTDRKGAEYMWWNNVETKPGTGYPTQWEDQDKYKGGWVVKGGQLRLRATDKARGFANIFFNPHLPSLDDYYEPWTYKYEDLFTAPAGNDQPTARPISMVTGEHIDIEAGPNWDDDLSGSPIYAANDPGLKSLSPHEKSQLFEVEQIVFNYLPRICNHCLNPGCVGACPAGAIYKRGEDGIVLVSQEKCRGWRFCISGCPYKKVYYNWSSGKSEKCILCYPRQESGQAPACFHSCVGRIRYLGIILYDADRITEVAKSSDADLVEAQRNIILDPYDKNVIAAAKAKGIPDAWLESAKKSPVYKFVKKWKMALPLHSEFRTVPSLFYIPPLSPVMATKQNGTVELSMDDFFTALDSARLPIKYLSQLLAAGNDRVLKDAMTKLMAIRIYKRDKTVGDLDARKVSSVLNSVSLSEQDMEDIYRLTCLSTFNERLVVPPFKREEEIETLHDPLAYKGETGLGFRKPAKEWGA